MTLDYSALSPDDVDDALVDLNTRTTALEEASPPDIKAPPPTEVDIVFGPGDSQSTTTQSTLGTDINEAARFLMTEHRGGDILIDGRGTKQFFDAPLDNYGVRIHTAGPSAPNGHTRTRLQPLFSHEAQLRQHEAPEGNGVQHWRAGSFDNITLINPLGVEGLATLQILGGNWARIRRIAQQHDVEHHILITDGFKSSGQYSVVEDFFGWSAHKSLIARRGPDIKFVRPVLYGRNQVESDPHLPEAGSIGVDLEGDSYIFVDPDVQFFDTTWRFNAKHVVVRGGATELGQYWAKGSAKAVISIGPDAQWIMMGPAHSFAHVDKVKAIGSNQRAIVELDDDAPSDLKFEILAPLGISWWQLPPDLRWCLRGIASRS